MFIIFLLNLEMNWTIQWLEQVLFDSNWVHLGNQFILLVAGQCCKDDQSGFLQFLFKVSMEGLILINVC